MPRLKFMAVFVSGLLVFGCMTGPRLGFPVKSYNLPVPVTLFSSIYAKGLLVKDMDIFSKESWRLSWDKKYLDMLSKVNVYRLNDEMDTIFLRKALEIKDLFIIEKKQVFHAGIEYSKNPDDPENYSGYDFSRFVDDIPTKYILALTVNEWGYTATRAPQNTGPYMVFTLQLIDKDTSLSVWQFTKKYWRQIEVYRVYEEPMQVGLSDIEKTMKNDITKALTDLFAWLK